MQNLLCFISSSINSFISFARSNVNCLFSPNILINWTSIISGDAIVEIRIGACSRKNSARSNSSLFISKNEAQSTLSVYRCFNMRFSSCCYLRHVNRCFAQVRTVVTLKYLFKSRNNKLLPYKEKSNII